MKLHSVKIVFVNQHVDNERMQQLGIELYPYRALTGRTDLVELRTAFVQLVVNFNFIPKAVQIPHLMRPVRLARKIRQVDESVSRRIVPSISGLLAWSIQPFNAR